MKLLVIKEARPKRTATLWESLAQEADTTFLSLDANDTDIAPLLAGKDTSAYDRVVYAAGLMRLGRDSGMLARINNLVVFGLDFCQDYVAESDYYQRYSALVKSLGQVRLIVTGLHSCAHYTACGIPTSCVHKAYDDTLIRDLGQERDIEHGFVGRTKHKVYRYRRQLLDEISCRMPLAMLKTADASEESAEYNELLNRIRFFISADAGFEEYMIKNFEAMAAGCVLCTLPTSPEENAQLGFVDMQNVIFFRSAEELAGKLEQVRQTPGMANDIATAGRQLAEAHHTWRHRGKTLARVLREPVTLPATPGWRDKLRLLQLQVQFHLQGR
ncbi:glycosyltransferase [Rhodocyclaceae bacterium]